MEYNLPLSFDDIENLRLALAARIEKCQNMNVGAFGAYWVEEEEAAQELYRRLVDLVE